MHWIMVGLSVILGINGLLYIFYPQWRAGIDKYFLEVSPNMLRLYGLIFLALTTLLLYYIYGVKMVSQ